MALSSDLVSRFVKTTKDEPETKKETFVYGTIHIENERTFVKIDGASELTPVATTTYFDSTATSVNGERVVVMIKNHSATILGNITSPSARQEDVSDAIETSNAAKAEIEEFNKIISEKVDTEQFTAEIARIDDLTVKNLNTINAKIEDLEVNKVDANTANISNLTTDHAEFKAATAENFSSVNSTITNLSSDYATFKDTSTNKFTAIEANISDLNTSKLSVEDAAITYANIDFANIGDAAITNLYSKSGFIKNITVEDGVFTGTLSGVTIHGDLIDANTVIADKLIIQGEDVLYRRLNTDGVSITSEEVQDDTNSLNGSIIQAKSIIADQISVSDLKAFEATIGGFNITDNSIYSGAKSAPDNTTRGIYLDNYGQVSFGDSNEFVTYKRDQNGDYHLEISASSILFGASKKSIENAISEASIENLEIGGRNLILNSGEEVSFSNSLKNFDLSDYGKSVLKNCHVSISFDMYTDEPGIGLDYYLRYVADGNGKAVGITKLNNLTDSYTRYSTTFELGDYNLETFSIRSTQYTTGDNHSETATIYVKNIKVEIGNKVTDWTPAPEDMATEEEVNNAQMSADEAQTLAGDNEGRISSAESILQQLSDCISTLVTDQNGTSLMTQTENGWTFSTSEIQSVIDTTSENLDALANELGDTSNLVSILQETVNDLGVLSDYVKIITYEDEPCIELGETDSDFKLMITNTRIMFREGSSTPAYLNNQSLYINKAVIEEELQQGEFVWKVRSNGNLGLVWKGGK